jgi:hypothetical protein
MYILLSKEEIKKKMKILVITKVFEPSKMLLLFISEDKEKT